MGKIFDPDDFLNKGNDGGFIGRNVVAERDDLGVREGSPVGEGIYLATSHVPGALRSYGGKDIFWCLDKLGALTTTKDDLKHMPPEVAKGQRYGHIPVTGANKPLSPFDLHRRGVSILGRVLDVDDDKVHIASRPGNLQFMLGTYGGLKTKIAEYFQENQVEIDGPTDEAEWEPVPAILDDPGPSSVPLADIRNVVFATGYHKPDLAWIQIPAVHAAFDPIDGLPDQLQSAVPGFFSSPASASSSPLNPSTSSASSMTTNASSPCFETR